MFYMPRGYELQQAVKLIDVLAGWHNNRYALGFEPRVSYGELAAAVFEIASCAKRLRRYYIEATGKEHNLFEKRTVGQLEARCMELALKIDLEAEVGRSPLGHAVLLTGEPLSAGRYTNNFGGEGWGFGGEED